MKAVQVGELFSCQTVFHVFKISPPFFKRTSISVRKVEGTLCLEGKGNN